MPSNVRIMRAVASTLPSQPSLHSHHEWAAMRLESLQRVHQRLSIVSDEAGSALQELSTGSRCVTSRRWPRTLADRATNDAPYDSRYDTAVSRPTLRTSAAARCGFLWGGQDSSGHASYRRHLPKSHSTRLSGRLFIFLHLAIPQTTMLCHL
jgi:hypothetical protein